MNLYYQKYGSGKQLIILHGIFGVSDNWVTYGKRISNLGFEVYILDQRNHGRSPHSHTFNYYALVDDLAEFIESKNIQDVVLLGHSMGGKVAIRYTLENPEMVSKLISVDVSLRTYVTHDYHRDLINAMKSVQIDKMKSRKEIEFLLSEKIASKRILQFLMKNIYWKDKTLLGWRINLDVIDENLESMFDGVFYSSRFEGPALFIRGGKSDYISVDDTKEIYEKFPNALIKTIPEGTHWVHADSAEEFYQITSEFLMDEK